MEKKEFERLKNMFNELLGEAAQGCVNIGEGDYAWKFYSQFYAVVEGKDNTKGKMHHTLMIPNLNEFITALSEYLDVARTFYKEDKWYYDIGDEAFDKLLTLNLVINAGVYDFHDFISYMETRKKLLNHSEKVGSFEIGVYKDFYMTAKVEKLPCNLEAPYKFTPYMMDRFGGSFVLPSVVYGVVDDTAYVYAVQGVQGKQTSKVAKDMDRYFRKFNKGVEQDVGEDADILNVSPNALASITLFNSYLKGKEIDKIVATEFMPVRYQSNKSSAYVKGNAKEMSKEEIRAMIDKHDMIQHNITEKFMYVLMRYCYHFNDSDFEYDDIRHKMKVKLEPQKSRTDNVIFELEDLVKGKAEEEREK